MGVLEVEFSILQSEMVIPRHRIVGREKVTIGEAWDKPASHVQSQEASKDGEG